ncbi:DUF3990 domain-containing protein [Virgibacillus halodenitrificans]|uniref:DUF3990 domain-containing protein n=1 Tax=Virgibacillus halodenitrificans TaxID=1482 RepID=UPI0013CE8C22|nr:DUF3990 domain-containing protein [Virgibacillus halodenitrificans]MCG1027071.1 DUF3990 domain-containing protein [Virgibacillus halodenitrificans]
MFINYDPNLPLYHGTIDLYSDSIVKHGVKIFPRKKVGVDFGPGFYLTNNFEQARDWAKRRADKPIYNQILELSGITIRDFLGMKNHFIPVVLEFKIKDTYKWEQLNYRLFHNEGYEWKQFVWNMRQSNQSPLQQKDWICGPVADGGLLSMNYEDIKAYNNKNQLAVLTNEAAQYLQLLEVIKC